MDDELAMLQPASSTDASTGTITRYMSTLPPQNLTGSTTITCRQPVNRPLTSYGQAGQGRVHRISGKETCDPSTPSRADLRVRPVQRRGRRALFPRTAITLCNHDASWAEPGLYGANATASGARHNPGDQQPLAPCPPSG